MGYIDGCTPEAVEATGKPGCGAWCAGCVFAPYSLPPLAWAALHILQRCQPCRRTASTCCQPDAASLGRAAQLHTTNALPCVVSKPHEPRPQPAAASPGVSAAAAPSRAFVAPPPCATAWAITCLCVRCSRSSTRLFACAAARHHMPLHVLRHAIGCICVCCSITSRAFTCAKRVPQHAITRLCVCHSTPSYVFACAATAHMARAGMQNLLAVMSEKVPKQMGMQFRAMMPEAAAEQVAMWERMDDVIMVRGLCHCSSSLSWGVQPSTTVKTTLSQNGVIAPPICPCPVGAPLAGGDARCRQASPPNRLTNQLSRLTGHQVGVCRRAPT